MIRGAEVWHLNLSETVLLENEMNQQLMAVFSSAKN